MTLLSRIDVTRLTGRKQRKRQIEHLAREGIPYCLDADGWPVVATDALNRGRNHVEQQVIEAIRRAS